MIASELITEAFNSKKRLVKEYRFKDQIFSFDITPVEGTGYVNIYGRDITERKKAEEATKLAYTELDQIFNTAADGMCLISKEFKILRTNDTFCTLFGVSKKEAEGEDSGL